jgi:hypothetical protein
MHTVIIFLLILVVVWVWTSLTKRRPEAPFTLKRTPKRVILFRLTSIPLAVTLFWSAFFAFFGETYLAFWFTVGGLAAIVGCYGFWWAIVNLGTFLYCPRYYWLWRRGGGDPWYDCLPEPFNTDDDLVRYQELYAERARQEAEAFCPPPPPPDPTEDPTANIRI